jgi:hypothetical protein
MRARAKPKTAANQRFMVKSRDSDCLQCWGSFKTLARAQSRLLDVLSAALAGVTVISADWSLSTATFRATCEAEGGAHELRVWISTRRAASRRARDQVG